MKKSKKILAYIFISSIMLGNINIVNASNNNINEAELYSNSKWFREKLPYSELKPPATMYYSKDGYQGYLGFLGLANEQGYAWYGGYLYDTDYYPIPTRLKKFLELYNSNSSKE